MINALPWQIQETLCGNVWRVFQYLNDRVLIASVVDPANTKNIVSDDLTLTDKTKIRAAADAALRARNWNEIVT